MSLINQEVRIVKLGMGLFESSSSAPRQQAAHRREIGMGDGELVLCSLALGVRSARPRPAVHLHALVPGPVPRADPRGAPPAAPKRRDPRAAW